MCAKPVIGIPADRRIVDPHPFHMVGEKYISAIVEGAGGIPLLVPALGEGLDPDELLSVMHGVFLTGSPSNVEPHHYAGEKSRAGTLHDPARDSTTLPLIDRALNSGVPLLAVCRGFQELNVALGGSLHQHVDEVPGYHSHRENPDDLLEVQYGPAHTVSLVDGGLLKGLAGESTVTVNSLHSQAVARLAGGVSIEAIADDGLVEAFRVDSTDGFALAVQWHPEWRMKENKLSMAIFSAFGDACRERADRRIRR
jgi:putative glutamine amidotransferase